MRLKTLLLLLVVVVLSTLSFDLQPGLATSPAISSRGPWLVFNTGGRISAVDANGTGLVSFDTPALLTHSELAHGASPAGEWLAFRSGDSETSANATLNLLRLPDGNVRAVTRLLTPAIFAPRLDGLSTVFIAGNADFLSVIENVHFKLKGTPSASEVEFLSFLLEQGLAEVQSPEAVAIEDDRPWLEGLGEARRAESALFELTARVGERLERVAARGARLHSARGGAHLRDTEDAARARRTRHLRRDSA